MLVIRAMPCKNLELLIGSFFFLPGKVPCLQYPPFSMKQSCCNVHLFHEHAVSVSQNKIVSLFQLWQSGYEGDAVNFNIFFKRSNDLIWTLEIFKPECFSKFMGCFVYILHLHFDNEVWAFPLFIRELKSVALIPKYASKHQLLFVAELTKCYRSFQIVCNFSLNRLRNPLGSQFTYNLFKQDAFVRKISKSELQVLFC